MTKITKSSKSLVHYYFSVRNGNIESKKPLEDLLAQVGIRFEDLKRTIETCILENKSRSDMVDATMLLYLNKKLEDLLENGDDVQKVKTLSILLGLIAVLIIENGDKIKIEERGMANTVDL